MRTHRRFRISSALYFLFAIPFVTRAADPTPPVWPEITRESKPWTRWWWPGSGVDRASLTAQLEKFAAAGLGGVEITPIYGAKGAESRYLDFLSPQWMEMLAHVGREGRRLGLGVDMATGTGWPFGGPWITPAEAATRAVLRDGRIVGEPTKQAVKRAAPGGEGLVVDPYSADSLRQYLAPFDKAFASFPRDLVRGQFHDSFEYFQASWTARLPEVFRERHGYDIQHYAAALLAKPGDPALANLDGDTLARIKSDYRDTLAQLHLDYLRTWVEWSRARGWLVRNQSHGAPANLLDLYGTVDIPETEIFGSTPFPIPGLRREGVDVRGDQDLPESLVVRMASSAAHVAGRRLASSESLTWLREHFREAPSQMKPELDRILCDGINHIFYHGTVFSPADAAWPGWLFYASTQFQPNNPLWDDLAALNRYVARIQSVLQAGQPDNDILLYWPAADIWDNADGLMRMLSVHDVKWLTEQPVGKLAQQLIAKGYQFDYISDEQLGASMTTGTKIRTSGGAYRAIIVPAAKRMPLETLEHLHKLAEEGASVLFQAQPEDVPGFARLNERRAKFKTLVAAIPLTALMTGDLYADLRNAARGRIENWIFPDSLAEHGLNFVRRARGDGGSDCFITNLSGKTFEGFVGLGRQIENFLILDPKTDWVGQGQVRMMIGGFHQARLQLSPGESVIVRTNVPQSWLSTSKPWPYRQPAGAPVALAGQWSLTFTKGGPELPPALTTTELKSWTDLGGAEAQRFAGTARYRLEFDAPSARADDWLLDLGDVRETARVRLNGRDVATLWSVPFRVRVGEFLQPGRNVLELDVTNLAANRIRDLDRRKVDWKIMREINFVNIQYKPFDASGWDTVPSGLLGPVTLTPLRAFTP